MRNRLMSAPLTLLAALLLTACPDAPREGAGRLPVTQVGGTRRPAGELQGARDVISPIVLHAPLLRCGTAVRVSGFAPQAAIRILEGGTRVIGSGVGLDPEGQMITLTEPLQDNWLITAVQEIDGVASAPSNQEEVRDHTEQYPAGLPRPGIPFLPLYRCGIATVADNLPEGGRVKVLSDALAAPLADAGGVWSSQSLGIHPPFDLGHGITAVSSICDVESQPSQPPRVVQAEPASLPAPGVPELFENGTLIVVGNLVNGSKVAIRDQASGSTVGGGGAPAGRVRFGVNPAVTAGQVIEVRQELCAVGSPVTTVTVSPCARLPPPTLIGPQAGDTEVRLDNVVPGSRVLIFAGSQEIGDGGGSVVRLTRPLADGEVLTAVQSLGACRSPEGYVVTVGSGLDDPGRAGTCQVESFRYGESSPATTDISGFFNSPATGVSVPMNAVPLRGRVFHPVGSGRYPVVMIVHGNTVPPSDAGVQGYDYLLEHLASHCMVAASIDEHFLNGRVRGEMDARAVVMLRHLQLLRAWDRDPAHALFSRIDHGNVMVAGHSRGGEAAVVAQKFNAWLHDPADPAFDFGFGIRAIYAIAPVDGQIAGDGSARLAGLPLSGIAVNSAAYFVIHGSHDGDVATFDGHRTYDRAFPVASGASHFKGLHFVHGANHKQFNTHWNSLVPDHPPTAAAGDVQTLNKVDITAYAFATLKGWTPYRAYFKREAAFTSVPAGLTVVRQYQDPSRTFINHYEEDNDLATASLAGASNDRSGSVTDYADADFDAPGPPHWLWEQTNGLLLGWSGTDAVMRIRLDGSTRALATDHRVLGFRIGQVFDPGGAVNPPGVDKDLTLRVAVGGSLGPAARIGDYVSLISPVHVTGTWVDGAFGHAATKTVMSTVRIPWAHILPPGDADFTGGWELRFQFDRQLTGRVVIDEIQSSE